MELYELIAPCHFGLEAVMKREILDLGYEIERVEGEIEDGGLVTVVDFRGRYMGTGFYNSKSLITVRLLTHRQEEITDELIASRVKAACDYRRFVMNRPGTDSCRLIYGEADRLPGVIADRFGGVIVMPCMSCRPCRSIGRRAYRD